MVLYDFTGISQSVNGDRERVMNERGFSRFTGFISGGAHLVVVRAVSIDLLSILTNADLGDEHVQHCAKTRRAYI